MWRLTLAVTVSLAALATAASAGDSVAYGAHPRQVLDVFPPEAITDSTPILVLFHGGGWSMGDKGSLRAAARDFARTGLIAVTPNYRLYPDAAFPEFIADSARAVAHAWRTLRTADGSPRAIVVGGWSAGAYNAARIALDRRYLAAEGVPSGAISGFIGLAGPYRGGLCAGQPCPHVFPDETRADWPVADAIDPNDPPILLIAAEKDEFVDLRQLEDLAAAATRAGVEVTTATVPDAYHRKLLRDLADPGSPVRRTVDGFLARVLAR